MVKLRRLVMPAAGIAFLFGTAVAAEPPLPARGHFIGYGVVSASSSNSCTDALGADVMTQLELNTVKNYPVFIIRHAVYGATAPSLYQYSFDRTGGTKLNQSGKVVSLIEGTGTVAKGTYVMTLKPFNPNSFGGILTLSFANCTETIDMAFVRSSAD